MNLRLTVLNVDTPGAEMRLRRTACHNPLAGHIMQKHCAVYSGVTPFQS
jgi:hypothetical protein